ncbi:hypothetical protein EMN47_17470 [Prolixibacteraceae bacterium JC049]|nr:hypothetical protein [Prolixibacteraceae bacterium JC049]
MERNSLKGLHHICTPWSLHRKSASEKQHSVFIDLYMQSKQAKRLLAEKERIELRLKTINNQLEHFQALKESVFSINPKETQKKDTSTEEKTQWNTIPLKY